MTTFEKVTNIAVTVLATAVFAINIYDRFVPRIPTAQATLVNQYIGKRLDIPEPVPAGKKATISLFVSKDCHFCSESMGFYRQLSTLRSTPGCDVKVVAYGPKEREKRDELQGYLDANGLSVDAVSMVSFPNLKITGTPTLLVQDGARVVRGAWFGKIPEGRQNEVVSKVQSFCKVS